jgi:hypothetical protein
LIRGGAISRVIGTIIKGGNQFDELIRIDWEIRCGRTMTLIRSERNQKHVVEK